MSSFYVYETTTTTKCERCRNSESAEGHEFCHECIHEMIMPGYSPVANELLADPIRKEGAK